MEGPPLVRWSEDGGERSARWRSERGAPPPRKVAVVDDRITADAAYGLACQGVGLLWRGDFQNARQMLTALAHRADRAKGPREPRPSTARGAPSPCPLPNERRRAPSPFPLPRDGEQRAPSPLGEGRGEGQPQSFHLERQARAQRARTLGMLLVPLDADYTIPLRRAPDVRVACVEAYGPAQGSREEASLVSLRELLGVIGAHEWRRNGVEVAALGARIHPHYGVFAPIRSEYVDLVAKAPLPAALASTPVAFDVGTGTGVLAAVLARRGVARVVATDMDPRALACARENVERLGLGAQVAVVRADLFPEGRAALAVCNPPWVPARPGSPLEHGIYDPDSRMLLGFLQGLADHLAPGGEGWLVLSDFAERLGLRSRESLLAAFDAAGLEVRERLDARPRHPRALDTTDPLHPARRDEVTSLWRLAAGRQ